LNNTNNIKIIVLTTLNQYRWLFLLWCCFLLSGCLGSSSYYGNSLASVGHKAPELVASPIPLNIIVLGGTSGIGLEVVRLSLQRGHRVTAVARRPERMSLTHSALSLRKGDITDLKSMNNLIPGHDLVISTIGIAAGSRNVTVFSKGIENVLSVMSQVDIDRLITVTAIGAGDSKDHGGFVFDSVLVPLILASDIKDKSRQETLVKASQTNWTIVRPGFLSDDRANRQYRVLLELDGIIAGDIARSDVAHFIVATFEGGLYSRQTVLLSN